MFHILDYILHSAPPPIHCPNFPLFPPHFLSLSLPSLYYAATIWCDKLLNVDWQIMTQRPLIPHLSIPPHPLEQYGGRKWVGSYSISPPMRWGKGVWRRIISYYIDVTFLVGHSHKYTTYVVWSEGRLGITLKKN